MAVYGYVRVSTDRQADEGESLGTQQRVIDGYAMMNGLTLDSIFVERGVSGSKPLGERPEGARLLAGLKAGDVVITPKLDRMFRSALDALDVLGQLKDRGVSLHMIDLGGDVTGNGVSKLVFTILSAVAEAERDRIRERIRDVKADQRKRQRYLGASSRLVVELARTEPSSKCPSSSARSSASSNWAARASRYELSQPPLLRTA
jgi:putative DNA-invertase from lambdoid prophage Rac